jgi:hypothetical protein
VRAVNEVVHNLQSVFGCVIDRARRIFLFFSQACIEQQFVHSENSRQWRFQFMSYYVENGLFQHLFAHYVGILGLMFVQLLGAKRVDRIKLSRLASGVYAEEHAN